MPHYLTFRKAVQSLCKTKPLDVFRSLSLVLVWPVVLFGQLNENPASARQVKSAYDLECDGCKRLIVKGTQVVEPDPCVVMHADGSALVCKCGSPTCGARFYAPRVESKSTPVPASPPSGTPQPVTGRSSSTGSGSSPLPLPRSAGQSSGKKTDLQKFTEITNSLNQALSEANQRQAADDNMSRQLNKRAGNTNLRGDETTSFMPKSDTPSQDVPLYTDPRSLPRDILPNITIADLANEYLLGHRGPGNFIGGRQDGSAGVDASIALGHVQDLRTLDSDNSVALVHDKLLRGTSYNNYADPQVLEAHRYARDNFQDPTLKSVFSTQARYAEVRQGVTPPNPGSSTEVELYHQYRSEQLEKQHGTFLPDIKYDPLNYKP